MNIETTMKTMFPLLVVFGLSCADLGTDVQWSKWEKIEYGAVSFSLPPKDSPGRYNGNPESGMIFFEYASVERISLSVGFWYGPGIDTIAVIDPNSPEWGGYSYTESQLTLSGMQARVRQLSSPILDPELWNRVMEVYFGTVGDDENECKLQVRTIDYGYVRDPHFQDEILDAILRSFRVTPNPSLSARFVQPAPAHGH